MSTLIWDEANNGLELVCDKVADLRSQEELSPQHRSATGVLLYPTVKHHLSEIRRIQGHTFRWETVDLTRPWQEIEEALLDLANSFCTN